jgi:hypothetical protein
MHIKDGGGASIAAILGEGTEADGLLFAAAPNLLAALKDMLTFGAELDSNGYAVRSRAEAAIAKTEGR